jgi:hypothetical protein
MAGADVGANIQIARHQGVALPLIRHRALEGLESLLARLFRQRVNRARIEKPANRVGGLYARALFNKSCKADVAVVPKRCVRSYTHAVNFLKDIRKSLYDRQF